MSEYRIRLTGGPEPVTIHKYNTFEEAAAKFNATKDLYPKGALNIETDLNGRPVSINPDLLSYTPIPADKDFKILNPELLTATKIKAEKNQSEVGKKYDLTDDGTGKKYDTGKSMVGTLCSVFPRALLGIGRCIEFGTHKYTKSDNWKLVENAFTRYQDSLMRHYLKFLAGEVKDRETGLPHLMHVGWNALAILELFLITNSEEYDKDLFLW